MKYKYNKKRRLFLSELAQGMGLLSVSSLFRFEAFAQNNANIQNVIFFFFNHTANIPKNDIRGTFHLGNGSGMPNLTKHKDSALFVRNCDNSFKSGTGNAHLVNQYAVFTGYNTGGDGKIAGPAHDKYAGVSMDLVAGNYLQSKYGSKRAHLNIAFDKRHGDSKTGGHPFIWETSTFTGSGKPTKPNTNERAVYAAMMDDLNCQNIPTDPDPNPDPNPDPKVDYDPNRLKYEAKKLDYISENMAYFKSKYLLPPSEFEKIEEQIKKRLESNQVMQKTGVNQKLVLNQADCSNFKLPNVGGGGFAKFRSKSNAFYDIMVHAIKYNYTRSITYYSNIWDNKHHGSGGHGVFNNPTTRKYQDELSTSISDLITKLKAAGIYENTMVVISGEFADQNNGNNRGGADHRTDKLPWLIFNSGKNGEYTQANHGTQLHPGDIQLSVLKRLGMNINEFGSNTHATRRRGNKVIF